jgi:PRTRC genetic system protein A
MNGPMNNIPLYLYQGYPLDRPHHLYDYVLAAQGLIKRVENNIASADCLLAPVDSPLIGLRLQPYRLQPLRFKLPRIPGRLLQKVLADARRNLDLEFMYHFEFDPRQGSWLVSRPKQEQSRTYVGYSYGDPGQIVLDLHSHNVMGAFFSPTDDRDEQGGRLYAVMGHLDRPKPELVVRLGMYGTWLYNVPGLVLFDDLGPFVEGYVEAGESYDIAALAEQGNWLTNFFRR